MHAKVSTSFLVILITLLSIRGFELSSRPLSISDAYACGNEAQAALMMNGAFSVVHNSRRAFKDEIKAITYLNEAQMQQILADNQMLPFNRVVPNYYDQPRNAVLILLESWSYQYIDGLSGNNYGVTPFFDSIVEKSMVWSNAYAAGQRSIEGMQAVLTSVPLLEGRDTIGFGLEQNRLTKIAAEANRAGYNTVFMQTSKRRSFQVNAVAGSLGFDHYFGLEDFPEYKEYPEESRFGWDHDGLSFFAEYLARPENQAKPYFGFFFTGTTHEPRR